MSAVVLFMAQLLVALVLLVGVGAVVVAIALAGKEIWSAIKSGCLGG